MRAPRPAGAPAGARLSGLRACPSAWDSRANSGQPDSSPSRPVRSGPSTGTRAATRAAQGPTPPRLQPVPHVPVSPAHPPICLHSAGLPGRHLECNLAQMGLLTPSSPPRILPIPGNGFQATHPAAQLKPGVTSSLLFLTEDSSLWCHTPLTPHPMRPQWPFCALSHLPTPHPGSFPRQGTSVGHRVPGASPP